jgi:chromosome segregation ATPase
MSKHAKQIGKGGCFSNPKELNDLNIKLKKINESLSGSLNSLNSISPEEKKQLEKELYELLNTVENKMNNNSNNATKRKQKQNNNNAIKRQLGLSDQEYSALSEELEKLEKELLNNSKV